MSTERHDPPAGPPAPAPAGGGRPDHADQIKRYFANRSFQVPDIRYRAVNPGNPAGGRLFFRMTSMASHGQFHGVSIMSRLSVGISDFSAKAVPAPSLEPLPPASGDLAVPEAFPEDGPEVADTGRYRSGSIVPLGPSDHMPNFTIIAPEPVAASDRASISSGSSSDSGILVAPADAESTGPVPASAVSSSSLLNLGGIVPAVLSAGRFLAGDLASSDNGGGGGGGGGGSGAGPAAGGPVAAPRFPLPIDDQVPVFTRADFTIYMSQTLVDPAQREAWFEHRRSLATGSLRTGISSSRQAFVGMNFENCFFLLDPLLPEEDIQNHLARVVFHTAVPRCHAFKQPSAFRVDTPPRLPVLIGTSIGDLLFIDFFQLAAGTSQGIWLQRPLALGNPVTAVAWYPPSAASLPSEPARRTAHSARNTPTETTQFVAGFLDGSLVVMDILRNTLIPPTLTTHDRKDMVVYHYSLRNSGAASLHHDPVNPLALVKLVNGSAITALAFRPQPPASLPSLYATSDSGAETTLPTGAPDRSRERTHLTLAAATESGRVWLLSMSDLRLAPRISHVSQNHVKTYFGTAQCIAWSTDGHLLAIGGDDDLISIFSVPETPRPKQPPRLALRLAGHASRLSALSFEPLPLFLGRSASTGEHEAAGGRLTPAYCASTYRLWSTAEDSMLMTWDIPVKLLLPPAPAPMPAVPAKPARPTPAPAPAQQTWVQDHSAIELNTYTKHEALAPGWEVRRFYSPLLDSRQPSPAAPRPADTSWRSVPRLSPQSVVTLSTPLTGLALIPCLLEHLLLPGISPDSELCRTLVISSNPCQADISDAPLGVYRYSETGQLPANLGPPGMLVMTCSILSFTHTWVAAPILKPAARPVASPPGGPPGRDS